MKLTPDQQRVARAYARAHPPLIIWTGATRVGKTVGGCAAMLAVCADMDGSQGFIAAQSIGAIERNIIPPMMELGLLHGVEVGYRAGHNPHLQILGNKIWCIGAADLRAAERLQGLTASYGWLDEALTMPEQFVQMALTRMSAPDARLLLTGNKASPIHWLRQRYILQGSSETMLYVDSDFDSVDHLPEAYRRQLDAHLYGHYRDRLLANEWAQPSGLVYPTYQTCVPATNRADAVSVDWAHARVFAALAWQRQRDGTWWVVDEYVHDGEAHGRLSESAHLDILADRWGLPAQRAMVVDASASSFIDAAQRRGWAAQGGRKAIDEGIQRTQALLTHGTVRVGENCARLIDELGSYAWAPDRDRPVHLYCDALDALRYMCQTVIYWEVT